MNNDEKILELKAKIATKKVNLDNIKNPSYTTNLVINLLEGTYNLNTLSLDNLEYLYCKLLCINKQKKEFGFKFNIGEYPIEVWLCDIKTKIDVLTAKEQLKELRSLESQLDNMLSIDKKNELEIDKISKLLEWG